MPYPLESVQIHELLDQLVDLILLLEQLLQDVGACDDLDCRLGQKHHRLLDVRQVVVGVPRNGRAVVDASIDVHQDVVLRHHHLPGAVDHLHSAVHHLHRIGAWINVDQTRLL